MTSTATPAQQNLMVLALVAILIWFSNLEYRKLAEPDEGRYAEIPREIVASGDWITPRLNGIKYFEKPPLQYWATALAYKLFGEYHWTSRLWCALTGFCGILVIYFTGVRLFGAEAGLYAALALASSVLYVLIGHINTLDMGVTFFMNAALVSFLLAQQTAGHRFWIHVAWTALGLAVLSKGLIGIALPGAVFAIYSLIQRDFGLWKRLHPVSGGLLFLAITSPWFITVSVTNPEFFDFFFVHEHFERYLTRVHDRYQPWWYFIPILLAGILPWLVTFFDALCRAWKPQALSQPFQPKRFLLIWIVFICLFFTLSSSKLPSYILPVFPAAALLIGQRLSEITGRILFWHIVPVALLALAGLALAPQAVKFASEEVPRELYSDYVVWLVAAAATLLLGAAFSLYQSHRERIKPALIALALAGLTCSQLALTGRDSLAPAHSSYHLAQKIKPYLKSGAPFYSVGMYEQTLPFYIKRTVVLVGLLDEMEFGVKQEPHLWLPDLAAFERTWRGQPYALAIMTPKLYREFEQSKLPMQMIASDTRRVVVKTL